MSLICVDIWGGEGSQDRLARYMLPLPEALLLAGNEVEAGFLVNLRGGAAWGSEQNFDLRIGKGDGNGWPHNAQHAADGPRPVRRVVGIVVVEIQVEEQSP